MRAVALLMFVSMLMPAAVGYADVGPTANSSDQIPTELLFGNTAGGPRVTCVECPAGAVLENGLTCYDFYNVPDEWNGGCNFDPVVFQTLTPVCDGIVNVCGWGGTDPGEMGFRDTDWYEITLTEPSTISVCCVSDFLANVFILAPDCADPVILHQLVEVGCDSQCISNVLLGPGTFWVFVASSYFYTTPCGQYVLTLEGYYPPGGPSAADASSWGTIKSLYK